jgi:hypothetical protein
MFEFNTIGNGIQSINLIPGIAQVWTCLVLLIQYLSIYLFCLRVAIVFEEQDVCTVEQFLGVEVHFCFL